MSHEILELTIDELDFVCGGGGASELSMIQLQSMLSKRAVALQLTTAMMNSMHESTRAIVQNIR